jgi:hypothetical protein
MTKFSAWFGNARQCRVMSGSANTRIFSEMRSLPSPARLGVAKACGAMLGEELRGKDWRCKHTFSQVGNAVCVALHCLSVQIRAWACNARFGNANTRSLKRGTQFTWLRLVLPCSAGRCLDLQTHVPSSGERSLRGSAWSCEAWRCPEVRGMAWSRNAMHGDANTRSLKWGTQFARLGRVVYGDALPCMDMQTHVLSSGERSLQGCKREMGGELPNTTRIENIKNQ